MYLYKVVNTISGSIYIGITKNAVNKRFNSHKCAAKRGDKNKFYDAIRSYGINNFELKILNSYSNIEELYKAERNTIKCFKQAGYNLYNILEGGASYFPIVDKEAWKAKLKQKRKGRKPSLGMKHTKENKRLFSKVSNKYWKDNKLYDENEIVKYSFKEAKEKFGISKTHYYRIRKHLAKN